jgi:hypothetical protein
MFVKSKIILAAAGTLILGLSACSTPPNENQQVQDFVKLLVSQGHKIDQVSDTKPPRQNASWETEKETVKKRKVNGKIIEVKKNTKIAEVVVVAPDSNCKIEMELPLYSDPTAFYADEGRDPNGKETDLDGSFNTDRPSPSALSQYVTDHAKNNGPLAFCAGKPYAPSPHSND